MRESKSVNVAAALTTVGASVFLWLSLHEFSPRIDPVPHQALGQVAAEEVMKLQGAAGHIIVIARDTVTFKNPATDLQLASFNKTLQKARASVTATKIIKMNPIGLVGVPPGDFFEIIRKASDGDVIVSFIGPPVFSPEQIARLGEKRPKVVAVCIGPMPNQINLGRVFEDKLLNVAIISRPNIPPQVREGENLRSSFERLYLIITPENLAELPRRPNARS